MKLHDEAGWVRVTVCCVALLLHHGLRDALLTALPTIAAASGPADNTTDLTAATTEPFTNFTSSLTPLLRVYSSSEPSDDLSTPQNPLPDDSLALPDELQNPAVNGFIGWLLNTFGRPWQQQEENSNDDLGRLPQSPLMWREAAEGGYLGGAQNRWSSRVVELLEDEQELHTSFKEGWTLLVEGAVVSSVYWLWLVSAAASPFLLDRVDAGGVLGASLAGVGLLGLLTHSFSLAGPWLLFSFRLLQGAIQGVSYPAVVRLLLGVPQSLQHPAAALVFFGPYVGTSLGAALGSLPQWYVATYTLGAVAVVMAPLCFTLPHTHHTPQKTRWGVVLRARAVWACVGVHVANTWMMHTLLVGVPFYLAYTHIDSHEAGGVGVATVALVAGVWVQALLFVAPLIADKCPLSALNRRRVPVVAGSVLVLVAVIVLATADLTTSQAVVGVAAGLGGVGVGQSRVGYRLNVDELGGDGGVEQLTRLLDVTALLTAALSPIVLTAFAQGGAWAGVWLVPLSALVPAAVAYLFLLSTNPVSDLVHPGEGQTTTHGQEAAKDATPNLDGDLPRASPIRLSFKSAKSALTFHTAMSRSRTRTVSMRTVDDDLDVDMHSFREEDSVDCRSAVDEHPDPECVSVASTNTFKSDGADMHSVEEGSPGKDTKQQFGTMLANGAAADRTSAWLSSHHKVVVPSCPAPAPVPKGEKHKNNAVFGLLW